MTTTERKKTMTTEATEKEDDTIVIVAKDALGQLCKARDDLEKQIEKARKMEADLCDGFNQTCARIEDLETFLRERAA